MAMVGLWRRYSEDFSFNFNAFLSFINQMIQCNLHPSMWTWNRHMFWTGNDVRGDFRQNRSRSKYSQV